jgi:hypothetical protein
VILTETSAEPEVLIHGEVKSGAELAHTTQLKLLLQIILFPALDTSADNPEFPQEPYTAFLTPQVTHSATSREREFVPERVANSCANLLLSTAVIIEL